MKTNYNDYRTSKKNDYQLYKDWKDNPSDNTLTPVLEYLKPTINTALTSFTGGDRSLRTRAYILATDAIKTYDPDKGASLKTHVYNNLRRLYRYKADRSQVVHIPENVRLEAVRIHNFVTDFKDKEGREPTVTEITDGTGLSRKKIQKAGLYRSEQPQSMFIGETGDTLISKERDPMSVWIDYVYYDLNPQNKKIYEWTTGYGGNKVLPKQEIAKRLKISPSAVSSRINTIMNKMQEISYQ